MEQRKRARDWGGRFIGPRVNCERVPALPACVVRLVLDDPRGIPYLLIWKDPQNETVWDAVRIAKYSEPNALDWTGWVEIKRATGERTTAVRSLLHAIARPLPPNRRKNFLRSPGLRQLHCFGRWPSRQRLHHACVRSSREARHDD